MKKNKTVFFVKLSSLCVAAFLGGCSNMLLLDPKGPVGDAERFVIIAAFLLMLIVAAGGVAVILIGILLQLIQLAVSIRQRHATRDLMTGDPWNDRTLEWATASPPPVYNFANAPVVHDIDAFMDMKEEGIAYRQPDRYHDTHTPKNTAKGLTTPVRSQLMRLGMFWHFLDIVWVGVFTIVYLPGVL